LVFRASGTDPDGLTKCCCRIVSIPTQWRDRESGDEKSSQLIVDPETLKIIMGGLVGDLNKLVTEENQAVIRAKGELEALNEKNSFRNVITQNSITSKYGMRMPYCDELTERSNVPTGRVLTATSKIRMHVGPGWEEDYDAAREARRNIEVEESFTMPSVENIDPSELVHMGAVTWTDADAVTNYNTGSLRY
jgi:hypothetical protein